MPIPSMESKNHASSLGSEPDAAANRSVRHGTCFRRRLSAHHAGAAPHSAVAELGVVRRRSPVLTMKALLHSLTYLLLFALAPLIAVSAEPAPPKAPIVNPIDVGWIRLLADPAAYNGKLIEIRGWLTVYLAKDYTAIRLYMSHEALSYMDTTLGIDVDAKTAEKLLPEPREVGQQFNQERVWIRGVFRATPETTEQNGGFPGVIEKLEILQQTKPGSPTFITK